jgi:membrane-associated phospholipid phosphatase
MAARAARHSRRFNAPLALIPPLLSAALAFAAWRAIGFGPLDRLELPLALRVHAIAGWSDPVDRLVIFLNRKPGEALCVLIILAAYAAFAFHVGGERNWRRIGLFAGLIFAAWYVANSVGASLEPVFARASPSLLIQDGHVDLAQLHDIKIKTRSLRSFPSNHGSVFLIVFFMCLLRWGACAWGLLPLCLVLSMPRVVVGAHWMSDTIIGSMLVTWLTSALILRTPLADRYLRIEDWLAER